MTTLSPQADNRAQSNSEEAPSPDDHGLPATLSLQADDQTQIQPCPLPQPEDCALLQILPGPVAHIDVFIDDIIGLVQGS